MNYNPLQTNIPYPKGANFDDRIIPKEDVLYDVFLFGETFFHGELSKDRPLIQAQGQTIELKGWQVFLGGKEWNNHLLETADGMTLSLVAHDQLLVHTIPLLKHPITLANSKGATFCIKGNAFGVLEPILDANKKVQDYKLFLTANQEACYLNGEKVEDVKTLFTIGDQVIIGGIALERRPHQWKVTGLTNRVTFGSDEVLPYPFIPEYPPDFPEYRRSPRIFRIAPEEQVTISQPEALPGDGKSDLLRMILPPLTMIGAMILMSVFTNRNPFMMIGMAGVSVVTMALSVTSFFTNKKEAKQKKIDRVANYEKYLVMKQARLNQLEAEQREALNHHYPDMETLGEMVQNYDSRIYEKTTNHEDFLSFSLGFGSVPASYKISFNEDEQKEDELLDFGKTIVDGRRMLDNAPIATSLQHQTVGLAGSYPILRMAISTLLFQLAVFHSYRDVEFIALVPEEHFHKDWRFWRWLPHFQIQALNLRGFVHNGRSRDMMLNSFLQIMNKRRQVVREAGQEKPRFSPHYILTILDDSYLAGHGLHEFLAEDMSQYGVTVIWGKESATMLPETVTTMVRYFSSQSAELVNENQVYVAKRFVPHHLPTNVSLPVALQRLANLHHMEVEKNAIPTSVTFLEMYKVRRVEELGITERWNRANTAKTLAVPLGLRGKDDIVELNLHERAHGPHGLVAGTTGSGKSEIVQSYILSLAMNFAPEDVGFLPIDFKGGGMANEFKELPHLLGSITNLDGAGSVRALASIRAELRKRQRLFGKFGVNHINAYTKLYKQGKMAALASGRDAENTIKSSNVRDEAENNVKTIKDRDRAENTIKTIGNKEEAKSIVLVADVKEDAKSIIPVADVKEEARNTAYQEDAKRRAKSEVNTAEGQVEYPDQPLPHLFLISDEFAELKANEPEFMTELVSTARIGRSLGVHLILATQKPSGVVDDQIWSNSRFKLALKVADAGDSNEIIKTPDAASIVEPGRAYLQVGNNEIFELFQSAWSGAIYNPFVTTERKVDQRIWLINDLGQYQLLTTDLSEEDEEGQKADSEEDLPTQLKAVVKHIAEVAKGVNATLPEKPWLPPLEKEITTPIIDRKREWKQPRNLAVPLGLLDIPHAQKQEPYLFNLEEASHTALHGSAGFGKSTVLQTLAMNLARQNTPEQVQFNLLDFGTNGLLPLKDLPHVVDIAPLEHVEKVNKFVRRIRTELSERKERFTEVGVASISQYEAKTKENLPIILTLVDGYDSIRENPLEDVVESTLNQLLRDGASVGMYLILTGLRADTFRASMVSNIPTRMSLFLVEENAVKDVVGRDALIAEEINGRGQIKEETPLAIQFYLSTQGESDLERLQALENEMKEMDEEWSGARPRPIPMVPRILTRSDFFEREEVQAYLSEGNIPLGLDLETTDVVGYKPREHAYFLIADNEPSQTEYLEYILLECFRKLAGTYRRIVWDGQEKYGAEKEAFDKRVIPDNYMSYTEEILEEFEERLDEKDESHEPMLHYISDLSAFTNSSLIQEGKLRKLLREGKTVGMYFLFHGEKPKMDLAYDDVTKLLRSISSEGLVGSRMCEQGYVKVKVNLAEPLVEHNQHHYFAKRRINRIKLASED